MNEIVQIKIQADYETAKTAGVEGTFQVISLIGVDSDGKESDLLLTGKVNVGTHYHNVTEVLRNLGLTSETDCEFI